MTKGGGENHNKFKNHGEKSLKTKNSSINFKLNAGVYLTSLNLIVGKTIPKG